jgi:hypothetical protein
MMGLLLTKRIVYVPIIAVVMFLFFKNFRLTGLEHVGIELRQPESQTPPAASSSEPANRWGPQNRWAAQLAPQASNAVAQNPSAYSQINASGNGLPSTAADSGAATPPRRPLRNESPNQRTAAANPNVANPSAPRDTPALAPANTNQPIRIGSFNLSGLTIARLQDATAANALMQIVSGFDVLALQNVGADGDVMFTRLTERLNTGQRDYKFLIGPRVGSKERQEQFAFIYDNARLETDRFQLYSIDDPQDLLELEPLVAWFRVRQTPELSGFSFTLVNTRIVDERVLQELHMLPELVQSVRMDGRQEDDCVVVGDFGSDARQLAAIPGSGLTPLNQEITKNDGRAVDNILISRTATGEWNGRSGALDFPAKLKLTVAAAGQVSEHLPVWAEFSPRELSP